MKIQEFALGESFIHRLDPRSKIIAAFLFAMVVALNRSITGSLLALVFPFVLVVLSRVSPRKVLLRLVLVNTFVGFLWLFLPFTVPGEVLYSIGPLELSKEGITYAILITLNSNAIVVATMALLGTSPVFNLVHALSHMGVPDKLVHIFFFCFRYIHVIFEEYHRLAEAAKIRGFKPGTNMHTYRTYAYFMGMLLVRSFDRAQRILAAMKCRGFTGKFYTLHHYEMRNSDYFIAVTSALFCAVLLVVR